MSQNPTPSTETIAAIDLGSNSFHMIVAQAQDGALSVQDRLREMVRLAAGLDSRRNLSPEAEERALACLARFGQRLAHLRPGNVRAVGTNTLRSAKNAEQFLARAEEALGHPIEIIAGVEEARLIYLGVAHTLADDGKRRLVMDIGGGSTELIIGERFEPLYMESLYMGCVSMSQAHFADGVLNTKAMQRAELAAWQELEPHAQHFRHLGWEEAVGASGTIRTVERVIREAGWSETGITLAALKKLVDAMLKAGSLDQLKLGGLSAKRLPVFPGGVMVLLATFEALGIERMRASDGALREGLLYDHLGRVSHEDVRGRTVQVLNERYAIDVRQAARVEQTALDCLHQVEGEWMLQDERLEQLLGWAAQLHEIGLGIAHDQYHKHGAYILEHADLAGFSRREQRILATLVRAHRRKFPQGVFKQVPKAWTEISLRLAVLLRLAVALHRSRSPEPLPAFRLQTEAQGLHLSFPTDWLEQHPLTRLDLEQEVGYLKAAGFSLTFS